MKIASMPFFVQFEGVGETFRFDGVRSQEALQAASEWLRAASPGWFNQPGRSVRVLLDFDLAFPSTYDSTPRANPRWLASVYQWDGSAWVYVRTERLS